ncbi:putative nuclease HARBI1 [Physella acuta]|uniref:putative nuclease HARBI1 n=1 Tax=Physella acuta TaxID=109671 RepID=UPI0027DD2205|nr:putative nuclease HARBI1 [Physella acuta]
MLLKHWCNQQMLLTALLDRYSVILKGISDLENAIMEEVENDIFGPNGEVDPQKLEALEIVVSVPDTYLAPHYSDLDFKIYFRMSRSTVENLCTAIGPQIYARTVNRERKVLASLWVLANSETFQDVADRFHLAKGQLHKIFTKFCNAIDTWSKDLIQMPSKSQQLEIAKEIQNRTTIPGVIGVVDGCHIHIRGPGQPHRDAYLNRRGVPSIKLMGTCDHNLRFIDVYIGWPGSVSDAKVFQHSPLKEYLESGNIDKDFHLVADAGYKNMPYLLTPYREALSDIHLNYNNKHSQVHSLIKKAFRLLKGKFNRLRYLDMFKIKDISLIIKTACTMMNFWIETEQPGPEELGLYDDTVDEDVIIDDDGLYVNVENEGMDEGWEDEMRDVEAENEAIFKRDKICLLL